MSLYPRGLLLSVGLVMVLCQGIASAQVVINELGAASSETLLRSHPDGRPRLGWGSSWCELAFDDTTWERGTAPFGFGAEGIATDLGERMRGRTPSLYLRKTFVVSAEAVALAEPMRLAAQADSGFVAYINGHEIARANLGQRNGFVYHNQSTFSSAQSDMMLEYESVVLASEVLIPGENVFAVQVQNTIPPQINERDQSIDESLRFEASMAIGRDRPIELTEEDWKYRIGHAEPSGGVVDWKQVAHPDVEGEFSDWIELRNLGNEDVDLSGWHLSDDRDRLGMWTFPDKTTIPAGGFLVVLADGNAELPGDYLHTNFALSASGEFLGLSNGLGELVSEVGDEYPRQSPFHSYGIGSDGNFVYLAQPSPGAANGGEELAGVVKKPKVDPVGGVYDDTVLLKITSNTQGAVIRYTLDGSEPTESNGMVYTGPLSIDAIDDRTGTPVRARAYRDGMVASTEVTQTYLVGVDEAFKTIPSLSLIADPGETFYKPHGIMAIVGRSEPKAIAEYYMPAMHGRPFERKVSMEVIYPDDGTNVQMDGGLRLSASAFSRGNFSLGRTDASPWVSEATQKPSFNLFFRSDYGEDTLDFPLVENYPVRQFRQFRLRAGKNDIVNPFIVDELARRVYTDTGQFGAVGIQQALFVNGSYKGYYNTVARLREPLFQEYYGSDEPWQVKHIDVWADGSPFDDKLKDTPEWERLEILMRKDLSVLANYQAVTQELDPVAFADYFIVNLYGATEDWPHNNLVIARELSDAGRWRPYMWDAEVCFGVQSSHSLTFDSIATDLAQLDRTPSNDLATVWSRLIRSPEWRLLFADRLQKHFFTPGGALTKQNLRRRMNTLETEIAPLMGFAGPVIDTNEIAEWIDKREDALFAGGIWEKHKLWGGVVVPLPSPAGGAVDVGTVVKLAFDPPVPRTSVYYTVDGSDPRLSGGDLNPTALRADADITLESSVTIKARAQMRTVFETSWGALVEASYRVGIVPADTTNFLISELMVNPEGPNEDEREAGFSAANFEYVEFYNASEVAIDLTDLRFTAGISYAFSEGDITSLAPGAFGVIVNDRLAFEQRYGVGLRILGEYQDKLNNRGESLEISNSSLESIVNVSYSDDPPWPTSADGVGKSLVLTSPQLGIDVNDPSNWVLSALTGGSPGHAEGEVPPARWGYDIWRLAQFAEAEHADEAISGLDADPDGDGEDNFSEFAFGSDPNDSDSKAEVWVALAGGLVLKVNQRTDPEIRYTLEMSEDLQAWTTTSATEVIGNEEIGAGLKTVTYRVLDVESAIQTYLRWKADVSP